MNRPQQQQQKQWECSSCWVEAVSSASSNPKHILMIAQCRLWYKVWSKQHLITLYTPTKHINRIEEFNYLSPPQNLNFHTSKQCYDEMEIVRLWLKCEVENILILRESLSMIFLNLEPPLLCGPLARRAGSSEVRAMRWARWREDNNHRLNRISMEWSKYSVAQRFMCDENGDSDEDDRGLAKCIFLSRL